MKKIFSILLFLFFIATGYAQLDSSINIFNELRLNQWAKKSNVPSWQIDGYRAIIFNGDTLARVNSGVFQAEEAKIYANGSNMSSALQDAFDYTSIKWISFASDSSRVYIFNGNVNAHGKTLDFKNGNKLTGTGTIDSLIINASDWDYIIDTTLSFTNLKTTNGYITLEQFGGKGDSVVNNYRYLQKAIDIATASGVDIHLLDGNYYVNGNVQIKSNVRIIGGKNTKISAVAGSSFTLNGASVKNILLKDFVIEVSSSGTNANIFNIDTDTTLAKSENINLKNIYIIANRKGNNAVRYSNVKNSKIENVTVVNSNNVSIQITYATNVKVIDCRVVNSGRSGIALGENSTNNYIQNSRVEGWMQNVDLTDGAFDSYGPKNRGNYYVNNVAVLDSLVYSEDKDFIFFRNQGGHGNTWAGNKGYSNSRFLLYGARDANRDSDIAEGNRWIDNELYISGDFINAVSSQGAKDFYWRGGIIKIDSSVAYSGTKCFFRLAGAGGQDTLQQASIADITLDAGGNANMRVFYWSLPVKNIKVSNAIWLNNAINFFVTTATETVDAMQISDLTYRSTSTVNPFPLNDLVKSFSLTGSNFKKGGSDAFFSTTSFTGIAQIKINMVNGVIGAEIPE